MKAKRTVRCGSLWLFLAVVGFYPIHDHFQRVGC